MAGHDKVYGICENKCFVEVLPKGQAAWPVWHIYDDYVEDDGTKTIDLISLFNLHESSYREYICDFIFVNMRSTETVRFSLRLYKDDDGFWNIRRTDGSYEWNVTNYKLVSTDNYDLYAAQDNEDYWNRLKLMCDDPDPYYLAYKLEPLF